MTSVMLLILVCFFFFNDTETSEIYTYWLTLSLHDALPIYVMGALFGLFGTVLILRDRPIDEHLFSATGAWSGYAAAFSCAIVWAVYSLSNRKFCDASSTATVSICGGVSLARALCHILFETSLRPTWKDMGGRS